VKVALSIGCPCGVGPEVAVLAAAQARARVVLVGDHRVVLRAAKQRGARASRFVRVARASDVAGLARDVVGVLQPTETLSASDSRHGSPTARSGRAQLAWIDAACDAAAGGEVDAMVTGPVSKEAIVRSRAPGSSAFRGHTEHLQARLGAREVVMAFWTPRFTTSLVTTHLALARVPRAVTRSAVAGAAYWLARLLARLAPRGAVPRIAVAALNPHAGEGGLLGGEERRAISPGIARARARLARDRVRAEIFGPVPAETAFRLAASGRFDGVVAMYHDQATIPMKVVGFGEAVNVSLGLPIVRTSVDHGTAYDIAGKGVADPRGMREAIALAVRLAR
jgi:4-hydroxythreonine-4-phosphate dehydrogenase